MYAITSNGLKPCQKFDIKIGCTYYLGASSSPDLVYILDVTSTRITYMNTYEGKPRTEDRRVVESLIADGCATIRARRKHLTAKSYAWEIKGQDIYEQAIGAEVPSWHFDRHTVLVTTTQGDPMSDKNWRAAEEFGGVGGIDDKLEIRCDGKSLADLRGDGRFVIVSEVCTYRAPLNQNEERAIDRSAVEESARRSA